MKEWKEITHYAGLDWASDHHDIAVVDQQGKIVLQQRFSQTAEGWKALAEQLKPFGTVAVAVETNHGIAVEQMLAQGLIVYPINPKSAERYRGRKSPSGVKNDQLDAWSLADALRLDGHGWKPLAKEDPFIAELRLLTRDEVALIEQRTGLINQLIAALRDYYPAALEAFDDWTLPGAWAFVERFPTPQALVKAGKRSWEKFLHAHKLYRPETAPMRLEIFARADQFTGAEGVTAARSLLASTLTVMLRTFSTASALRHSSQNIPTTTCLVRYRGLARNWGRDCWQSWETTATGSTAPNPCNVLRARHRSPSSRDKSSIGKCAGPVISGCGRRCIFGPTPAAALVRGRRLITQRTGRKAKVTPARCDAWGNAGSKSCGKCGRRELNTTQTSTHGISRNTDHGC
jgi:hypothetical protein